MLLTDNNALTVIFAHQLIGLWFLKRREFVDFVLSISYYLFIYIDIYICS